MRNSLVEYKHYGIMLCPSMHCVMVKCQCVLYIGWSRYTEIIIIVIIEHVKVI